MASRPTDTKQGIAAFTLVEMMVAFALCMLLLAGMVSIYAFTTKSFASLSSYTTLNQKSRYASDLISRDVRSCITIDDTTTSNRLVLNMSSGTNVTYLYNAAAQTLVRSNSAEVRRLLTNVVSLSFALYQRPDGVRRFELFPVANPGSAKLVGFDWRCAERIVGSQNDSQDLETGIVELRNK
jgi:hypothetical protein